MKIILTDHNTQKEYKVTKPELARLAVELHGSGFTEDQVVSAMEWQWNVVNEKKPVEFEVKGISFTIEAKTEGVAA